MQRMVILFLSPKDVPAKTNHEQPDEHVATERAGLKLEAREASICFGLAGSSARRPGGRLRRAAGMLPTPTMYRSRAGFLPDYLRRAL